MRYTGVVVLIALFIAVGLLGGAALAAGSVECVKLQCETKGRACVEALYADNAVCMKAGNTKCAGVPAAEKFNCLRSELSPCATDRNHKQDACLAEFRSCYAVCGPLEGKRADYWCVAEMGTTRTAAFCVADPGSDKPLAQCEKAFTSDGPFDGGLTCEQM